MIYDLIVIGGGVNGAAVARDAAGRGLSVLLVEQDDLASHTSSASTKLIHGGLRYLEHYEFRLVREALKERERLLSAAPHIIWPLRFVLPHDSAVRPAFLIRLGLFLYDHLAKRRRLPASETLDLETAPEGRPLKPIFDVGFAYSDCWVEDSRLVVLNAIDAAERGAKIRTRTRLVEAVRGEEAWQARLEDHSSGVVDQVAARAIVNCAGPWVAETLGARLGLGARGKQVRLVKGSHIVVPRLYEGEHAYILQNADRRIVFAIPYERAFTLIGTTDLPVEGDAALRPVISAAETAYLIESIRHSFDVALEPRDVVWSYSGVRPLFDDGSENASAVTRDYVFDLDSPGERMPVLSVFGGKITTARVLAEQALDRLSPFLAGCGPAWTEGAAFPGGDLGPAEQESADPFAPFLARLRQRFPFLPADLALRLARAYGTRAERILGNARTLADLGQSFGAGLTEAEIAYLRQEEWARDAEDILWRRSKLGLHMNAADQARLAAHLSAAAGVEPSAAALADLSPPA